MLVIREQQMEAMRRARAEEFVAALAAHLRETMAEEAAELPAAALLEAIRAGVARARAHGITRAEDVARFCAYVLRYGADFGEGDGSAWARRILAGPGDGGAKMDRIERAEQRRFGGGAGG